ncbi:lincosamide nucleotidyltransferase A/C/D/E [Paractinoplanes atraurantiacus]|uniref:Lincosamide nucleotidyltransferase A/C/D/E n=2 Tax=Paractinoplanes atraurantiacus TaxID=1036182 RepID=A0A285KKT2_9ACTN|nr:lincosamide nucleotidyltransferase A/C/D/E [Actinoplanes atraurantiacus]
MSADDAVRLLDSLTAAEVEFSLSGGWAVDALLHEQTREHTDLDLFLPAADLAKLVTALARHGIDRIAPRPDTRPWNFVLHDGSHLQVDLHLYEPLPNGALHYGPATENFSFPAEALTGQGEISGRQFRCETPTWSVRWHTGYPPRPADHHDVPLLCDRFNIARPEAFR